MAEVTFSQEICRDAACAVLWADHWQTLIGAAIALPLAFWAILVPVLQERSRRRRHFNAMRASMPLRLSLICDYAVASMKALTEASALKRVGPLQSFAPPSISPELVDGLERTIESVHSTRVVGRLSDIVAEMQTLNSRMSGLASGAWPSSEITRLVVQAAKIYAMAGTLFLFARRRRGGVPQDLKWGDVWNALLSAQIYEGLHPEVFAYISEKRAAGERVTSDDERPPLFRLRMWWAITKERVNERWAALRRSSSQ